MSLHGAYDDQNIFAKIIRGEMGCVKVHEDENVISFMDIFPQSRGHTLVVPKAPARNLLEISEAALAATMGPLKHISAAVEAALKPDGIAIVQFNGAPAGQSVFHIHFHIIPRWENQSMASHGHGQADLAELEELAAQIRAKL
jgi:histidine triad (HIT) family protein